MTAVLVETIGYLDPGPPRCDNPACRVKDAPAVTALRNGCGCLVLLCAPCTRAIRRYLRDFTAGDALQCMRCKAQSGPLQEWSEWLTIAPL